ncbi:MAG: LOG family protein YgdH [Candidatus Omnitrophica bacterium ADurb.Bin277]|nr:MAG: LOG family protein YgdH [Candidatus Omnitrophica bacterium ADurb.Bin277]
MKFHRSDSLRVAVLGSGTISRRDPVYCQAVKLGKSLAEAGFTVCHGGYGGVMEAVAKGCRVGGGVNTGVIVGKSASSTPGAEKLFKHPVLSGVNPWVDAEIRMPSWEKRLLKLVEMGQAYIFLDGATGTLNELFFVWEMANKELHGKPVIILGKRLRRFVKLLKKDPAVKIPGNFHLAASISQSIQLLRK